MKKKQQIVENILEDMKQNISTWEDYLLEIAEEHLSKRTYEQLKEISGYVEYTED